VLKVTYKKVKLTIRLPVCTHTWEDCEQKIGVSMKYRVCKVCGERKRGE